MPDSVFRCCGRPRASSVSSGNTTARVSPRKGLPGEHRGRHSQEMPMCGKRSRMEGGGSGRWFSGMYQLPQQIDKAATV